MIDKLEMFRRFSSFRIQRLSTHIKHEVNNSTTQNRLEYWKKIQDRKGGINAHSFGAVKALEFATHESGNYLNLTVVKNFSKHMDYYKDNVTAIAVFLGTESTALLSSGIHEDDSNLEGEELFTEVQNLSRRIAELKNTIGVFCGAATGTPMGIYLNSQYRIGNPSFELSVDELSRGQIPLGGFAFHMINLSDCGLQLARYLAFSGAKIRVEDLYSLGVLTHLTYPRPYQNFTLGATILEDDFKDVYQPPQGNVFVIPDLLEDIDINSDMNIHDEPIWLKYLHVPFEPLEEEALAEDNIRVIYDDVVRIFALTSIEDILSALEASDKKWAFDTLTYLSSCDPLAIKAWFEYTSELHSSKAKMMREREDVVKELEMNKKLQDSKNKGSYGSEKEDLEDIIDVDNNDNDDDDEDRSVRRREFSSMKDAKFAKYETSDVETLHVPPPPEPLRLIDQGFLNECYQREVNIATNLLNLQRSFKEGKSATGWKNMNYSSKESFSFSKFDEPPMRYCDDDTEDAELEYDMLIGKKSLKEVKAAKVAREMEKKLQLERIEKDISTMKERLQNFTAEEVKQLFLRK